MSKIDLGAATQDIPKTAVPEGLCLLAYCGSIAHGTHNPDPESIDDIDLIGFVVAPIEVYFGLTEWGSRGTLEVKEGRYDGVYYELRKAFNLLLVGNPNILSTLWTEPEHILFKDSIGTALLDTREMFLGKHIYGPLVGYASSQLSKMESQDPAELQRYLQITNEMKVRRIHPQHKGDLLEPDPDIARLQDESDDALRQSYRQFVSKGRNIGYMGDKRKRLVLEHGYDAKNAAHCVRLLRMGLELFRDGGFLVSRPDAEEIRSIKTGQWTLEQVKEHARDLFAQIESACQKSPLPEAPDRARVERFLVSKLTERFGLRGAGA